jgi:hypothetical protein
MTASAKPDAVPAPRKRGPIQQERTQHEDKVYGYAHVRAMLGPWAGSHGTVYEIYRSCCETAGQMTHSELTQLRCTQSARCSRCAVGHRADAELEAPKNEGSNSHAVLNRKQLQELTARRAKDEEDKLARVAARRAQAEAKLREAHARATGRSLFGQPDFDAPLPIPAVPERTRKSRRRG